MSRAFPTAKVFKMSKNAVEIFVLTAETLKNEGNAVENPCFIKFLLQKGQKWHKMQ